MTLTATITKHLVVRDMISRFTSLSVQLSIVSVADDTGEIQLLLRRNAQHPNLVKGMVLKIDKGYVRDYLGIKQLRIRSVVARSRCDSFACSKPRSFLAPFRYFGENIKKETNSQNLKNRGMRS